MTAVAFLTLFLIGLPSHAAEPNPFSEMEPHFQKMLQAIEESGYSNEEVLTRLKTARDGLYRQLQAKTRTELEALLSRDMLYAGPLPVMEPGWTSEGKPTYQILSPDQLHSRAQAIAQDLVSAFEQTREQAINIVKQSGAEYGTCHAKEILSTMVPLTELTAWANSYDFRVNKQRGIRRFNEMFHRLHAEWTQKSKMMALDCMLAGLAHRTSKTEAPTARELTGHPTVIDADTLMLGDARIRLHGIDAPEKNQRCTYPNGVEYLCGVAATEDFRAEDWEGISQMRHHGTRQIPATAWTLLPGSHGLERLAC